MEKENHNYNDINKFPKDYGIVVFPVSISRAENMTGQDPKQCLEYLNHFSPSKVSAPKIGLNMVYADYLYMSSSDTASTLKDKFMSIVLKHKNSFNKLVAKNQQKFQIQHAFSYQVWNQLYLNYKGDFASDFKIFKKIYEADSTFQKYVAEDARRAGKDLDENQINFFLEEHLMFYFMTKMKIALPNEYIMGREKWLLPCYPGKPLKAQIYTYQLNPFNLDAPENPYQDHFYDLESKKLTNMLDVDLENYNYEYPRD